MNDKLKTPVHLAILKPTHIQKLAEEGVIKATQFGVDPNGTKQPLPKEEKVKPTKFNFPGGDSTKKAQKQVKLRVIHESIPPLAPDKQPPCNSCKTSACCYAFVVNITELEYESGLYGDAAVKLTPEIFKQLNSKFAASMMLTAPRPTGEPVYFLEGKIGIPCVFLTEDKRCGIYDVRPGTCRSYTCVGDQRITQGMRDGTEPIDEAGLIAKSLNKQEK